MNAYRICQMFYDDMEAPEFYQGCAEDLEIDWNNYHTFELINGHTKCA